VILFREISVRWCRHRRDRSDQALVRIITERVIRVLERSKPRSTDSLRLPKALGIQLQTWFFKCLRNDLEVYRRYLAATPTSSNMAKDEHTTPEKNGKRSAVRVISPGLVNLGNTCFANSIYPCFRGLTDCRFPPGARR
jgi:hypothetical protein